MNLAQQQNFQQIDRNSDREISWPEFAAYFRQRDQSTALPAHRARRDAAVDYLTGLPNRRAFLDMLDSKLRTAEQAPFAFALVDLDHFKRVNDSYGHTVGDAVLTQIGRIMHDMASEDCFFARLGGEEFGIIATGLFAA